MFLADVPVLLVGLRLGDAGDGDASLADPDACHVEIGPDNARVLGDAVLSILWWAVEYRRTQ